MKAIVAILALALLALIARQWSGKPDKEKEGQVAVDALQKLVAAFPEETHESPGRSTELYNVTYNARKTDSLSAPIVGTIKFSQFLYRGKDVDYELIYHWRNDAWEYQRLVCLTPDVNVPLFEAAMESSPEIRAFTRGIPLSSLQSPTPTPISTPTPVPLTPEQIAEQRAANRARLEQMTRERLARPPTREDAWKAYYQRQTK